MPTPARLWVIDDDRAVRFVLAEALRDTGRTARAVCRAGDRPA